MKRSNRGKVRLGVFLIAVLAFTSALMFGQGGNGNQNSAPPIDAPRSNAMTNPYRMLEQWPHLGNIKPGAAIGIVPDGKGGVWLQHRSAPAIVHIDASGNVIQKIDVTLSQAHGMCQDRDGNFWALDSGPFTNAADAGVKGNQVFKYSPEGKLLLTLGNAGVAKAGTDTFLQPVACTSTPDGNITRLYT